MDSIEDHKKADELLKKLKSEEFLHGDYTEKTKTKEDPKIFEDLDSLQVKSLQEKYAQKKRIVTNIVDFVPFVGSAKMAIEGIRGKQFGTDKEIHGVARVMHTAFGVGFFALDCTGVGIIAEELGKGVIKFGEIAALRTAEEIAAREIIKKEVAILAARGMTRIDRKEEIANAPA